ncbi:30S ribosomal protein S15 [archaeon]|nr:30S ribosomal protein S15 [archaeon]|tara:strand:- start:358 stop:810 length:453 start_codon:yes stop_codon:yes gene_type:complete
MARMHSRKKGKAGSRRPHGDKPAWTSYSEKEIAKLAQKYQKQGKSTSEIGMIMRDTYGIASVRAITGKKIGAHLDAAGLKKEIPEDMMDLIKRLVAIQTHIEKNKQDQTAKRGRLLTDSKIRRLEKYYKSTGRLSKEWKLDRKRLKMYLE